MPSMSGVRPDRFDQVEFIGAVDIGRYAVRPMGRDELGFSEVVPAINALGVAVPHQERRSRFAEGLRPGGGSGTTVAPAATPRQSR